MSQENRAGSGKKRDLHHQQNDSAGWRKAMGRGNPLFNWYPRPDSNRHDR